MAFLPPAMNSKENSLWNCDWYHGGWRRKLHPTASGRYLYWHFNPGWRAV